ncbi:Tango13 [Bugula neritina]|uniref:Protein-tyrosine sulfotransferase n=1 Tax=Bugula neritina TaxID=10212 RepID=A0A7J7KTN6_BUGNE|nr:Tango13 [Bugula neritina]
MHTKTIMSSLEMSRLTEAHIDERLLREALASYILTIIAGHGDPAPLLCNKDPFAIRSMSHIRKMFPNSKFIMMIRGWSLCLPLNYFPSYHHKGF